MEVPNTNAQVYRRVAEKLGNLATHSARVWPSCGLEHFELPRSMVARFPSCGKPDKVFGYPKYVQVHTVYRSPCTQGLQHKCYDPHKSV